MGYGDWDIPLPGWTCAECGFVFDDFSAEELATAALHERWLLEGARPGAYVRVELRGVPAELITRFDLRWPLILGGALKAGYDLLLLAQFHDVRPPEEAARRA